MLEMFSDADPMRSDDFALPADGWRDVKNKTAHRAQEGKVDIEQKVNEVFDRIKSNHLGPRAVFSEMRDVVNDLLKERDDLRTKLAAMERQAAPADKPAARITEQDAREAAKSYAFYCMSEARVDAGTLADWIGSPEGLALLKKLNADREQVPAVAVPDCVSKVCRDWAAHCAAVDEYNREREEVEKRRKFDDWGGDLNHEFQVMNDTGNAYHEAVRAMIAEITPMLASAPSHSQQSDGGDCAVAAIEYAIDTEEGLDFLRYWFYGEFDVLRRNWDNIPDRVFIGADPLFNSDRCPSQQSSVADAERFCDSHCTWRDHHPDCPSHESGQGGAV